MKYIAMTVPDQAALFARLAVMPDYLAEAFEALPADVASIREPDGSFSPVEQCWHLADLERDAYRVRIQKLLTEPDPFLPDFDGERVAAERAYRTLSLTDALAAFREARTANLEVLRAVPDADWIRSGVQEGVGAVALCDVPAMMAQHDEAHREEIEQWKRAHGY